MFFYRVNKSVTDSAFLEIFWQYIFTCAKYLHVREILLKKVRKNKLSYSNYSKNICKEGCLQQHYLRNGKMQISLQY